jgi:hypothetical protein
MTYDEANNLANLLLNKGIDSIVVPTEKGFSVDCCVHSKIYSFRTTTEILAFLLAKALM